MIINNNNKKSAILKEYNWRYSNDFDQTFTNKSNQQILFFWMIKLFYEFVYLYLK